jgi:hypothetical protein
LNLKIRRERKREEGRERGGLKERGVQIGEEKGNFGLQIVF